jgi:hypothetical protein
MALIYGSDGAGVPITRPEAKVKLSGADAGNSAGQGRGQRLVRLG